MDRLVVVVVLLLLLVFFVWLGGNRPFYSAQLCTDESPY